ncbi:MAG TPA: DUF3307 domain-containing protein [Agriterribacter sp.]|nr:DUF3307 domain-containing protein [Agriterribacter sp.]
MSLVWITKLLFSHLLTDFVMQRGHWITDRTKRHFLSPYLYLHTIITGTVALLFIGFEYWYLAMAIFITHTLIDGWKSYRPDTVPYFLIDQLLHLLVILGCWYFAFFDWQSVMKYFTGVGHNYDFWVIFTAFLFLSFPSGIIIEKMTSNWRKDLDDAGGLARAGKWIGILERMIILIFLLQQQYAAIGLLITAKGLLRFNEKEKDKREQKTEYILIGSLISVAFSLITGVVVTYLLNN